MDNMDSTIKGKASMSTNSTYEEGDHEDDESDYEEVLSRKERGCRINLIIILGA